MGDKLVTVYSRNNLPKPAALVGQGSSFEQMTAAGPLAHAGDLRRLRGGGLEMVELCPDLIHHRGPQTGAGDVQIPSRQL